MVIHVHYKLSNILNIDCLCCLKSVSTVSDKTNTPSPTCLIRKSPSERFGHISPEVMKRLDPSGKVPIFN